MMASDKNDLEIPLGSVDWGALRRMEPVSAKWGFDRGTPIDRHYIEQFLARCRKDIRGRCIEVMNGDYTRRFGDDRVAEIDVVDIRATNPDANIVGDLADRGTLRQGHYDCFVLTQTLPVIYDCAAVVRNCYGALRPGGSLLVTAPFLCRYSPHPIDYWRFTDSSLGRLLSENTDCVELEINAHGNLIASIAFLHGLAAAELQAEELEAQDSRFPIVVTARCRKPPDPTA